MERLNFMFLFVSLMVLLWGVAGQYEWQIRDAFDEVRGKMDKVNSDNCFITHLDDLYLPEDSVSHHPDVKEININPVFPNRTALLHLHNMAMNRAFFWSYILQSRFIRPAINDTYDPGMMYYFLSAVADVAANPYINASSIYFSPNMSYTSSYRGFFNKTMPRFAPRAFRADDFNDPVHLQKISTLNTFHVEDLGAFDPESLSKDYTSDFYRTNEFYKLWLPDKVSKRHDTKTTYQVEIRYSNNTNETFTFHGPRGNDENPGPVNWTRPYFDCGRLNKWLVGAVSPVADIYPRHTQYRHIEYPTYTAAVVMELDYDRIDINQCPKSQGNDGPNRFASTARCKMETTECEPISGWGFRRGGYQCRCAPGYRLPKVVRRPYLGEVIERATSDQYYNNFDCKEIGCELTVIMFRNIQGAWWVSSQMKMVERYRLPKVVRRPYLGEVIERATSDQYYNNFDCKEIGCELTVIMFRNIQGAWWVSSQMKMVERYRLPKVVRRPYLGEVIERATSDQYYNNFDCKEIGCELTVIMFRNIQGAWWVSSQMKMVERYRLPKVVRRPYLGEVIERATSDQYYNNFDCKEIGWKQRLPVQWEKAHPFIRALYMDQYYEYVNATSGPAALHTERVNVFEVLNFIRGVQPGNCSKYNPSDLFLNGDIAFGAEEQFENQAKMAVRLANFISAFLQVSDPREVFSGTRVADKPLTEDQMFGETLAIILGDTKVWSAGTYWDRNKFTNRTFFAPLAYKTELNTRKYKLEDMARLNKTEDVYTNKPWFQFLKQRWSTNFDDLEKFFLKMKIRDGEKGEYLKKYERYPTYYRAANLKHGHWTRPYFDCNGHLKQWVITYGAPFFGWDNVKVKLEFKGVVAVTMPLMSLDINQCPDNYYIPNAFKGTDKCDKRSSYCVPILGRGFDAGGYKCECLQGYEYPFEDYITYYDGQIVEAEFQNIISDKETRIDMFKCRLAGAAAMESSVVIVTAVLCVVLKLW